MLAQNPPAEDTAYLAARALTDPKARMEALQQFLSQFPSGSRSSLARQLLLDTYLKTAPQPTEAIRAVAAAQIDAAPAGFDRWVEEAGIADRLASADPAGADLPDAALWAEDAVASLTEESYRREMARAQLRYKLPKIPPKQLHTQFVQYRTSFLAALANVDLRRGKIDAAAGLLAEASRLQPTGGEVNSLRGQLALARKDAAGALQSFERADAVGSLQQPWRNQEAQLFRKLEHGDDAALDRQVDDVYRHLYPPLFALAPRHLPPGGHSVLLELFTGSGCEPCAGPDLALDSLLASYGSKDLLVLAYDEHIPRPDPLSNPDAVARAAFYGVESTPAAFLDGQPMEVLGGSRQDVENIVVDFADQIEDQASLPSGLRLSLAATEDRPGDITVAPNLTSPFPTGRSAETTGDVSLRKLAHAVLYVALVQDHVRYSGQNGVRFHRMVVRALRQSPAAAYLGGSTIAPRTTFHLPGLQEAQATYLADYEQHNDRFGAFQFHTEGIQFLGGDFAVIAWVQDLTSKRVLQSAEALLPSP